MRCLIYAPASIVYPSACAECVPAWCLAQAAQLQAQLLAAQQVVAESVARGDHSRSASQASDRSTGCYDHWNGSSLFTADTHASGAFGIFPGAFGLAPGSNVVSRNSSPSSGGAESLPTWEQAGLEARVSDGWGAAGSRGEDRGMHSCLTS